MAGPASNATPDVAQQQSYTSMLNGTDPPAHLPNMNQVDTPPPLTHAGTHTLTEGSTSPSLKPRLYAAPDFKMTPVNPSGECCLKGTNTYWA